MKMEKKITNHMYIQNKDFNDNCLIFKTQFAHFENKINNYRAVIEKKDKLWNDYKIKYDEIISKKKSDLIRLNVGGQKFTTYKEMLISQSFYFKSLFKSSTSLNSNFTDELFIDRNGDQFELLLNYMIISYANPVKTTFFNYILLRIKDMNIQNKVLVESDYYIVS